MLFNPSAGTTIKSGEKIIAIGSSDSLGKLEKVLNP
jgi:K+/H+ antiporter YhaU regulatory subunit KhtT